MQILLVLNYIMLYLWAFILMNMGATFIQIITVLGMIATFIIILATSVMFEQSIANKVTEMNSSKYNTSNKTVIVFEDKLY